MGDGQHRCVGACLVAVGMSASVLAGSAVAAADTETTSPSTRSVSDAKAKKAAAEKHSINRADAVDSDSPTMDDTTKAEFEPSETETVADTDTPDKTPGEAQDRFDTTDEIDVKDSKVEVTDHEFEPPKRSQKKTGEYTHETASNKKPAADSVEFERLDYLLRGR